MSFGGSTFGGGGFGSSNTNNTGSLFGGGGFGANNNTNTGFGSTTTTGFGGNTANTGSAFGGFGASNTGAFGAAKPAFGAAANTNTGGSLFGNNTNNTTSAFGGGGFGGNNNAATSTGFGASNTTGGGLFGAAKPATGFGATTGGSMFGGGGSFGNNAANSTATTTGFGAGASDQCQGTAQPPFNPPTEKEANSSITNHYQSIVHMPNYQKWSFEELRLADYNAGRRFANASGQAGGFGANTGFGGFSNNNATAPAAGGLFGANNNTSTTTGGMFGGGTTSTGFGANNNQSNNTFGGFGASKPATTGGLFGATNNTATSNTGSLFGGTTAGGFGTTNNTTGFGANNNTTGGFGANNAAKPSLFGAPAANTGGGLFGNSNTTTNTGGGLFGGGAQQQNTGFGANQTPAASNPFGTNTNSTGGGLFGANNNQPKPGGLFGNAPAANTGTTSLFGNTNQNTQQTGGLFGGGNTANNNTSLFGAAKPATTSLFGAPAQQQQTTSLFGNTQQNQQAQGGLGLFGNAQKPTSSLFGTPQAQQNNTGSSMFGNPQQQQQQQQPQNSLFGNTMMNQSQQNNLQPPQGFQASIQDARPYGSISIFDGLPAPPAQSLGPIATPISSGQKQRKPAVLPQWKLNPTMSARFVTPQKQGYGFSYSRYGTPSSVSSVASTPGHFGGSLLGGSSVGRNIGKSVSVSNLRRTYDNDAESVLAPGAFTSSSRISSQHSLKKLNIDRSLRNDLFAPVTQGSNENSRSDSRSASALKKRVSFEAGTANGSGDDTPRITNAESSPTPTAEEQGYLRSSTSRNLFNGQPAKDRRSAPESSPVKGNELAIVPEDGSPEAPRPTTSASAQSTSSTRPGDPDPGNYWTRPSIDEIKKMSKDQLKKLSSFTVGRGNVGQCEFNEPVDLSSINWNNFFDVMVKFNLRSICVYPDQSQKPPVGMGINVPSTITLKNCWPRSRNVRSGPRLEKHIKALKNVNDCDFIAYNVDTGEWSFRVPHFTTYGLDYDEEDDDMDMEPTNFKSSMLSDTFSEATPDFVQRVKESAPTVDSTLTRISSQDEYSYAEESAGEDTFGWKGSKVIPGGFEPISIPGDEDLEMEQVKLNGHSFLDQRSAVPESEDEDEPSELPNGESDGHQALVLRDEEDIDANMDIVGAFPDEPPAMPKSILKHNIYDDEEYRQPGVFLGDDWAEQLQRTISPRKRDRQNLRASQAVFFRDADMDTSKSPTKKSKANDVHFESSIDLMNSLFGEEELRKSKNTNRKQLVKKDFQWPYNKDIGESTELDQTEQAFHGSFKPHWGPGNVLIHAISEDTVTTNGTGPHGPEMEIAGCIVSQGRDVRLSKFSSSRDKMKELNRAAYTRESQRSNIVIKNGVPFAEPLKLPLIVKDGSQIMPEEALIWQLAAILFDEQEKVPANIPDHEMGDYACRVQKDRLSSFWSTICRDDALSAVGSSQTAEERAIHYLSMGAVLKACQALLNGRNFRLATLIAQIGGDKTVHEDMTQQIEEWRRLNVLSEMSDSVRTLYELLAGNVCVAQGKQGAIEDRAATFNISQKYKLGWNRTFGLRLWYAITDDEPIEAAVKKYLSDLEGAETTRPKPWFLEKNEGYNPPWSDPNPEHREDVLWGLLRLFTERSDTDSTLRLSDVVAPETVRGNPIDSRLSWELYFALLPHVPEPQSSEAADKLTISFATELQSANLWTWAIFVLLHLSNPDQRSVEIRNILARHAGLIDIEDENTQQVLFKKFLIPESWVYEAKALYARSVEHDRQSELEYLQRAGNWTEAHNVLCRTVAPKAIIELDHTMLSTALADFAAEKPHNWRFGGAVYQDYLALLSSKDKAERAKLLKRLVRSIPEMSNAAHAHGKKWKGTLEKGSQSEGFLESVAIKEMAWVVGEMMLSDRENDKEHGHLLHLPLSNEMRRERSRDLGIEYYRKIMGME